MASRQWPRRAVALAGSLSGARSGLSQMDLRDHPERVALGKRKRAPKATRPSPRMSEDAAPTDFGAEDEDSSARFAYPVPMPPSLSVVRKRRDFLAANRTSFM